jgi:hypothetical protein
MKVIDAAWYSTGKSQGYAPIDPQPAGARVFVGMDDSLARLVVTESLVRSYPAWTDEYGTNVEQLAKIAVEALSIHGLLSSPVLAPSPDAARTAHAPRWTRALLRRTQMGRVAGSK